MKKTLSGPCQWGDIIQVGNDIEIVYLPDNGRKELESFIINQPKQNGHYVKGLIPWCMVRVLKPYSANKDTGLIKLMEPLRKGVCINNSSWVDGVDLLFNDVKEWNLGIDFILNPQKYRNITDNSTINLLKKFWYSDYDQWRVLYHYNEDWCTWKMSGPFKQQKDAEHVFQEVQQHALAHPPKFIRHGIYKNTDQINVIILFQGPYMRMRHCLLIGQGEDLKYPDGINRDVEFFSLPDE